MKSWLIVKKKSCQLCASTSLADWAHRVHGFPIAESGSRPYVLSGSTVAGTTIHGDITSDGESFGRSGSGDLGGGIAADSSLIIFPIVVDGVVVTYEYKISAGGKHIVQFMESTALSAAFVRIGSWSSDNSNTIGTLGAGVNQAPTCRDEYPPPELDGQLSQESGVWRKRIIAKTNRTMMMKDGDLSMSLRYDDPFPRIRMTRCYVQVMGYVAMMLGPGVRIRNLRIA